MVSRMIKNIIHSKTVGNMAAFREVIKILVIEQGALFYIVRYDLKLNMVVV